jgi:hypothetical protein
LKIKQHFTCTANSRIKSRELGNIEKSWCKKQANSPIISASNMQKSADKIPLVQVHLYLPKSLKGKYILKII